LFEIEFVDSRKPKAYIEETELLKTHSADLYLYLKKQVSFGKKEQEEDDSNGSV